MRRPNGVICVWPGARLTRRLPLLVMEVIARLHDRALCASITCVDEDGEVRALALTVQIGGLCRTVRACRSAGMALAWPVAGTGRGMGPAAGGATVWPRMVVFTGKGGR